MRPMQCFVGPLRFVYVLRYVSWLSKTPHFWGCTPRGTYDPQIRTRPRFLCNARTPSFIILLCLLVRMLSCWHINSQTHRQTHKQTPPKTSNVLRYATTLGNQAVPEVSRCRWRFQFYEVLHNGIQAATELPNQIVNWMEVQLFDELLHILTEKAIVCRAHQSTAVNSDTFTLLIYRHLGIYILCTEYILMFSDCSTCTRLDVQSYSTFKKWQQSETTLCHLAVSLCDYARWNRCTENVYI